MNSFLAWGEERKSMNSPATSGEWALVNRAACRRDSFGTRLAKRRSAASARRLESRVRALRRLQCEQEPKSPFVFTSERGAPFSTAGVARMIERAGVDAKLAFKAHPPTGFIQFEYSLSGKWVELLKQIAPGVTRAAVLRDPNIPNGIGQFAVIQSVAPSVGLEVTAISVRDAGEIERAVTAFARSPNGGLIVTPSALTLAHRELIIGLAAQHKLPAVYYRRYYVDRGGLASYGYDVVQQYRGAAGYVDRILKGEKPADLPVQAPTKYELVINLKTAKALGLTIPPSLLARADEVIE